MVLVGTVPYDLDADDVVAMAAMKARLARQADEDDRLYRLGVSLQAQVNQWRFQAENADSERSAQGLRECAYDLEKLIARQVAR